MTREEAILCLKGMKNYARDTFTEQTDWQDSLDVAIKALEKEPMIFKSSTLDTEKLEQCRQRIKEQIEEGVVLLPYYIDLISPYESNTEQLYLDKEPPVYKEGEANDI